MQVFYQVVSLLGGLALFLYGMRVMGDGLKSSSGGAMRTALEKATANPALAFLLGVLVTCMIQSSTATIVLTVGLVGAGFLKFRQSIGIVLGANVGTAITAQIIRLMDVSAGADSPLYFFKSDNLAPLALLIGMILIMFVKKRSATTAGTICMGFGMLFVGLMNMSAAVAEVSDSLSTLLVSFEDNYFLGFLSGVFVTGVIQSSSAVVGILQSIASTMGVHFCGVFAIIIGVNIGDCLTTYLVCRLGAKPEQIRTCMVHIIYNVFAAALIIAVLVIGHGTGLISDEIWNMPLKAGGVANVHGLFRLVPAVLLLPFSGLFANIAEKIV
ncbi:MAG: Na/Pi symporter, partial [Clostridiales bacterium]|nr:Na/Pi symporter [Clostridiales bacterium]